MTLVSALAASIALLAAALGANDPGAGSVPVMALSGLAALSSLAALVSLVVAYARARTARSRAANERVDPRPGPSNPAATGPGSAAGSAGTDQAVAPAIAGQTPAVQPAAAPRDTLAAPRGSPVGTPAAAPEAGSRLARARLELRFAESVLSKVPAETEAAAFALMDRIITIRDSADKARQSAITSGGSTATDDTIVTLTENARQTIADVRSALANMRKHDRGAETELQSLGKEISGGMAQLAEIGEITERSRLIAFNMAIEAARIGSKGNGFKVIVNELRDLNDRTAVFSKRVSELLGRFKDFTDSLARKSSKESSSLAMEVERGIHDEEKTIESLMAVSHACLDMSGDIEQVVNSVNKDLDGILESLQFQDITRQIVEGAQAIIKNVQGELEKLASTDGCGQGRTPDQAEIRDMRARLVAASHTRAEKEAIQEAIV